MVAGLTALGSVANAADKLTLQLKWVTCSVRWLCKKIKGFTVKKALMLTLNLENSASSNAGGGADVVLDWMPSALATRKRV